MDTKLNECSNLGELIFSFTLGLRPWVKKRKSTPPNSSIQLVTKHLIFTSSFIFNLWFRISNFDFVHSIVNVDNILIVLIRILSRWAGKIDSGAAWSHCRASPTQPQFCYPCSFSPTVRKWSIGKRPPGLVMSDERRDNRHMVEILQTCVTFEEEQLFADYMHASALV